MLKRRPALQDLPIDRLVPGKYQPRQHFGAEKLRELADSIKATGGLLQPIVVRPAHDNYFEIVAGERRWRAAQLANLHEVSCLVCVYTDEQALQASLIENLNRSDLSPIEEATAYQRLIDEFHYVHEEIAAAVGKSRASITNSLRLLKLEPRVQALIANGGLSEGHGKILASLPPILQIELAENCVKHAWNVRKVEAEAKKRQQQTVLPSSARYQEVNLKHLETSLADHIGNRVNIEYEDRGGGYLRIRFNNIDELEGHFERIGFNYNGQTHK